MANPVSNHLVSGTVRDRLGNLLTQTTVTLTHPSIDPVLSEKTGSDGKYIINLSGLDKEWTVGQNITLFSSTQFKGRRSTTVTISSETNQTVNLTMEETFAFSIAETDSTKRHNLNFVTITTYDQEKVTHENPLPVDTPGDRNINDPATSWTITRGDLQPDSESITLANGDVHKRTFTYDSNSALINRSAWVKQ